MCFALWYLPNGTEVELTELFSASCLWSAHSTRSTFFVMTVLDLYIGLVQRAVHSTV